MNFKWSSATSETVTITETPQPGFAMQPVACFNGQQVSWPTTPVRNGVQLTVGSTDIVNCTFKNRASVPAVSITKTPVDATVQPGDPIAYDLVVTAGGTAPSTGVTVTDTLPAGYTWTDDSAACAINAGVLTCSAGDLAPAATFTVRVSAPTPAGQCATVTNTASVDATNIAGSPDGIDSTENGITIDDGLQCVPPPVPAISIAKTPVTTSVLPGEPIAYDLVATAGGTGPSTGVTISDTLPTGYTWTDNSDDCAIAGGVLTCTAGDLAPLQTFAVRVTASTPAGSCTTVDNAGTVNATNIAGSPDGVDNTDNVVTIDDGRQCVPLPVPAISILKTPVSAAVAPGADIAYDILVTAGGTGPSTGVTISDTLPVGYTWTDDSPSCTIAAGVLSCTVGELAPGASFPVRVTAATPAGQCVVVDNSATVDATNIAGAPDGTDSTDNQITITDGSGVRAARPVPQPPGPAAGRHGLHAAAASLHLRLHPAARLHVRLHATAAAPRGRVPGRRWPADQPGLLHLTRGAPR